MKPLEPYLAPSDEEMKEWSLDAAKRYDAVNKEIYTRDGRVVANAKAILLDASPGNPSVRDIEAPVPPITYTRVIQQEMERDQEKRRMYEEREAERLAKEEERDRSQASRGGAR